ncbi:MAG TPA: hypothetical protein VMS64_26090 [Candidatus Methylomirabilis sp.]|nr:hypothetical protein [Candidatus Methylomirabilis sp.]
MLQIPGARSLPFSSPSRIRATQDRRVRSIVAHAYRTVPFYGRIMDERGMRPGDFQTAADLARLPLVSGQDLARDPQLFLSTAAAAEPLLEVTSSGSSGHAKRLYWDRAAVFRARAAGVRQREVLARFLGPWHGYRTLAVSRRGGTLDVVRSFHAAYSIVPARLDVKPVGVHPEDSFEHNLEVINSIEPDLIIGFGAYIGAVYRWAHVHGRTIFCPRLVAYGGEQLPPADRELLETTYGIPVLSSYQSCEALRIAFQCPHRNVFHVHADQVALRIADVNGETQPAGERGQIVISNLINRATVLLNYAIGDLGVMADASCPCGRNLPALASLDGRADDLVTLPNGELAHDSVLLAELYGVAGVIRVQLVQETRYRFRIRVVHRSALPDRALREQLTQALVRVVGREEVEVHVDILDELASAPSGKFQSIVSHVRDS